MANELFPMVDYKIPFVSQLFEEFPDRVFSVYLLPPSFEIIRGRMERIGRQLEPARIAEDTKEVAELDKYGGLISMRIVNEEGLSRKVAEDIYRAYLRSIIATDGQ
jgi:hypothetical protein